MTIRKVPSLKDCKDCGNRAYSYQIGWEDEEKIIHWHKPKHLNQCEECRKETYRKIEEKKKANKDALSKETAEVKG